MRTACSATRTAASAVSSTPAAKPQVPSWTTRTAKPRSSSSFALSSRPSRRREDSDADPLQPEVGVRRAEVAGTRERRVGEFMTGEGEEARVDFRHGVDLIHGTGQSPAV